MSEIPAEWWKRAVEVVPYGVACVSLDNRFLYANHSYCQLVGYSQAELVGRTWMSITLDDDVGGDLKSVDDLKANETRDSYTLEKRYIHRDGHPVPVRLLVHSFIESGQIRLFIACVSQTMTTEAFIKRYESEIKSEVDALRQQIMEIREERAFRLKVFGFVKSYWPIIGGLITLAATAIWNLAKVSDK